MCSRQRTCQKKRNTWQTVWNTNFTWKGSSQFPEISQLFWHGICSALEYGQEIARYIYIYIYYIFADLTIQHLTYYIYIYIYIYIHITPLKWPLTLTFPTLATRSRPLRFATRQVDVSPPCASPWPGRVEGSIVFGAPSSVEMCFRNWC